MKLICAFVFAQAIILFSHDAAHMVLHSLIDLEGSLEYRVCSVQYYLRELVNVNE